MPSRRHQERTPTRPPPVAPQRPAAPPPWLQAGNAAVSRLLARQPAPAVQDVSFKDLWERFIPLATASSPQAKTFLPQLVAALEDDAVVTHGDRLLTYLLDHGESALARRALEKIEAEYRKRQLRFHLKQNKALEKGAPGPDALPASGFAATHVDGWITRGRDAARAGDHALAQALLSRAYLYLQMQAERAGPTAPATEHEADATRAFRYASVSNIYEQMRVVLRVYPQLERELAANDPKKAAQAREAGATLRQTLRSDLVTGAEGMIADVSRVTTARGEAIRIRGERGETDVTALPGLPIPGEIGANSYQAKPMEEIHAALEGQVDLLDDLLAEPGVRKAFPKGEIDMTKRADRLKVWKAIYDARKGGGGTLRALMDTIGRYLKAFTVHTDYNIRDFGAQNYVQAEETGGLPVDLAGRAERDCGVYALTVASELSQTAKAEGLALDFQLVTTLDHAMLVIKEASGTFYIVSNQTITPPLTGDVALELGKIAGGIRGRRVSVMPAMTFDLGSSMGGGGRAQYSDASAWTTYKQAQFGLGKPGEDKEPLYKQYYDDQAELENLTGFLEIALLARRPKGTDEGSWLAAQATKLRPAYARAAFLWQQWGTRHAWRPDSAAHGLTLGTGPLTLARYGKMILRRQALKQALDPLDVNTLAVCDAIPPMHQELDAYRAKGTPPDF
jgi:hypothetical protein